MEEIVRNEEAIVLLAILLFINSKYWKAIY
jgi:hypothetical protein